MGSVFDGRKKDDEEKKRSSKSDSEKEKSNPILGKIGEIATKSLVKYISNEISNFLFTGESND